jgi:CTP:phosphocholine cytidylyltransferase-like protein
VVLVKTHGTKEVTAGVKAVAVAMEQERIYEADMVEEIRHMPVAVAMEQERIYEADMVEEIRHISVEDVVASLVETREIL